MLWIAATNPPVSCPSARVRTSSKELFVVVQDAFLTRLHIAESSCQRTLGRDTARFTNVDRTVHICHKARPPGDARSDFDIFLDYATHGLSRQDDALLVSDAQEAFEAETCTRGRPCDYSGLSYKARTGHRIQWPSRYPTTGL